MAERRADSTRQDIDEIVRLHNLWSEANRKGSIPMMRAAFVGGDKFFGWNLNGFAYEGIEEWATLWKFLGGSKAEVTLDEDEDLGGQELPGSGMFRSTEIYVREDEAGKPVWKMWHCHFSPLAKGPRMAFEK